MTDKVDVKKAFETAAMVLRAERENPKLMKMIEDVFYGVAKTMVEASKGQQTTDVFKAVISAVVTISHVIAKDGRHEDADKLLRDFLDTAIANQKLAAASAKIIAGKERETPN